MWPAGMPLIGSNWYIPLYLTEDIITEPILSLFILFPIKIYFNAIVKLENSIVFAKFDNHKFLTKELLPSMEPINSNSTCFNALFDAWSRLAEKYASYL